MTNFAAEQLFSHGRADNAGRAAAANFVVKELTPGLQRPVLGDEIIIVGASDRDGTALGALHNGDRFLRHRRHLSLLKTLNVGETLGFLWISEF